MEYTLIDMQGGINTREKIVIKAEDPDDWRQIHNITVAIRGTMLALINECDESVPGDLYIPIATLPPENRDSGAEFYVKTEMFLMLRPRFMGIVWDCIHDEIDGHPD